MGFENVVVDELAEQAGGRLKGTTLVQKRVRELERGWPALVPVEDRGLIQIAVEEFRREMISLALGEDADELRDQRVVEERERARQIEAQRRASEIEAGHGPLGATRAQSGQIAGIGAPVPGPSGA